MKKKSLILVSILLLCAMFCLVGCNSPSKIDRYYKKLEKATSATIVYEMQAPIFGKMSMTMRQDGNKSYTSGMLGDSEEYTEIVGDTKYTYKKTLGAWTKEQDTYKEETTDSGNDFAEFFNSENYKYSRDLKKFVLKDNANVEFLDGMESSSLTLEIEGDKCTITGEVNSDGLVMPFTIVFKGINETTITLPEVA